MYNGELIFNCLSTDYDWLLTDEYLCIKRLGACSLPNKMVVQSFWENDFVELQPIGESLGAVNFTTNAWDIHGSNFGILIIPSKYL